MYPLFVQLVREKVGRQALKLGNPPYLLMFWDTHNFQFLLISLVMSIWCLRILFTESRRPRQSATSVKMAEYRKSRSGLELSDTWLERTPLVPPVFSGFPLTITMAFPFPVVLLSCWKNQALKNLLWLVTLRTLLYKQMNERFFRYLHKTFQVNEKEK